MGEGYSLASYLCASHIYDCEASPSPSPGLNLASPFLAPGASPFLMLRSYGATLLFCSPLKLLWTPWTCLYLVRVGMCCTVRRHQPSFLSLVSRVSNFLLSDVISAKIRCQQTRFSILQARLFSFFVNWRDQASMYRTRMRW